MDSLTSAAPDEKPPELASATQLNKEKSKPSGPLEISAERFNSSVGRLTSNSIDGLQALALLWQIYSRRRSSPICLLQ
jgi:hypothetical protein